MRRIALLLVASLAIILSALPASAGAPFLGSPVGQTSSPVVGMASTPSGSGYWIAAADGSVYAYGDAGYHGSAAGRVGAPVVGITSSPNGGGYWLVGANGAIYAFGNAGYFGSAGSGPLNRPVVGMATTPDGGGYWLVATDGGIFAYGNARFFGSTGNIRLNQPIVGIAPAPGGNGYWMVASDGGIFAFGDAPFYGSTGDIRLNQPVVGMAATPDGRGYWMVATDGGIFAFGNAPFHGSTGSIRLNQPVRGIEPTPSADGYWLVAADGGLFSFPGSLPTQSPAPAVGAFDFMIDNTDGSPVRYNPCDTIHYVANVSKAPAQGLADIHQAFAQLSAATGISFVYDGTTSEMPRSGRPYYQPSLYGERYAPILVAWDNPGSSFLPSGPIGMGGSTWRATSSTAPKVFVTGQVALDATRSVPSGFGTGVRWGGVLLHELGHVVGLDHVSDQSQLMYGTQTASAPAGYQSGDLAGLDRLGRSAGCLSVPPVR